MEMPAHPREPTEYTKKYKLSLFDKSRPVQVVKFDSDPTKAPKFYPEKVSAILDNGSAKGLKIFVLSVNGVMRSGKSFLLNLLVNYFNYTVEYDPTGLDWKAYDKRVRHGNYQQSVVPITYGIWIWDHPFIVGPPGKEVALLLMDCQGLGDSQEHHPNSENVIINTSLELSSMFIWNSKVHFDNKDLDKLKLCTDFANLRGHISVFASIVFVTRNWQEDGKVGNRPELLKAQLGSSDSDAMKKIKRGIRCAFATKECFVLPYPGKEVTIASDNDESALKVGDIDVGFVDAVGELCEAVLSRLEKRDQLMWGSDLERKFKALDFRMKKLEETDLLLKDSAQVLENFVYEKAMTDAQSLYEEELLKLANSSDQATDDELLVAVKDCVGEAKNCFDLQISHYRRSEFRVVYEGPLRSLVESYMVDFELLKMLRRIGKFANFDKRKAKELDAELLKYLKRNRGLSGVVYEPEWYQKYMLQNKKNSFEKIQNFFSDFSDMVKDFFRKLMNSN